MPGSVLPRALAHEAAGVVLGEQALHAVEHRFVERDVDHLALARSAAP